MRLYAARLQRLWLSDLFARMTPPRDRCLVCQFSDLGLQRHFIIEPIPHVCADKRLENIAKARDAKAVSV